VNTKSFSTLAFLSIILITGTGLLALSSSSNGIFLSTNQDLDAQLVVAFSNLSFTRPVIY